MQYPEKGEQEAKNTTKEFPVKGNNVDLQRHANNLKLTLLNLLLRGVR